MHALLLLLTILSTCGANTPAPAATTTAATTFVDPSSLSSTEAICMQSTTQEYAGDGGFEQSERAGNAAASTFDPDSISSVNDRQNIFKDLLGGNTVQDQDMNTYVGALVAIAVLPIMIAVFNGISCVCCVCCRNCCRWACPAYCRVCKCIPKATHYTKEEQYLPVAIYSGFAVLLFGFAIAGMTNGVHKFNDSLVEGICLSDNTYLRFSQFLTNVNSPLAQLETDFKGAVVALTAASKIDPTLSANVAAIGTKFADLKRAAQDAKAAIPTTNPNEQNACAAIWDSIISSSTSAEAESTASAKELDTTLQDLQKELDTSLIQQSSTASDALSSAKTTLSNMQKELDKSMDPRAFGLISMAHQIKSQKDNAAFAGFGFWFIIIMLVSTSIFGVHEFKHHATLITPPKDNKTLPLQVIRLNATGSCFSRFAAIGWCSALFFGIFCGVFAALMLPLAAVMDDVCVVLPTLPAELGTLSGEASITNIIDTCWNKTGNLLDGMGLSDSIDVDNINFDSFDKEFGGSAVDIDSSGLDKMSDELNNIDQVKCGDVTPVSNAVTEVQAAILVAERGFAESSTVKKLKTEGAALVSLIKTAVSGFIKATNCWFIKLLWDEVVTVMCSQMRGSIQWWGSAELFIGLICLPFAITVLFMMKRYGGHGPIAASGATQTFEGSDLQKEIEMTSLQNQDQLIQHQEFLDVMVPLGHGAGAFLSIVNPNSGEEMTVTVPEGCMEGQMFSVQLPAATILESEYTAPSAPPESTEVQTNYVVNVEDGGVMSPSPDFVPDGAIPEVYAEVSATEGTNNIEFNNDAVVTDESVEI